MAYGITSTPGWPRVQETFFDPARAWSALPAVATGLWLNIRVMLVCGVLIADLRADPGDHADLARAGVLPAPGRGAAYVDMFRGFPLLLVFFLLGFSVPALRLGGLPSDPLIWGGAALVLTYSSYVAEVLRAGIDRSTPRNAPPPARSGCGTESMRFVVLPQAFRRVVPPLLNDLVSLQKDSGLIAVLGVVDAIRWPRSRRRPTSTSPRTWWPAAVRVLTIPLTRITDWVARRQGWHGGRERF